MLLLTSKTLENTWSRLTFLYRFPKNPRTSDTVTWKMTNEGLGRDREAIEPRSIQTQFHFCWILMLSRTNEVPGDPGILAYSECSGFKTTFSSHASQKKSWRLRMNMMKRRLRECLALSRQPGSTAESDFAKVIDKMREDIRESYSRVT